MDGGGPRGPYRGRRLGRADGAGEGDGDRLPTSRGCGPDVVRRPGEHRARPAGRGRRQRRTPMPGRAAGSAPGDGGGRAEQHRDRLAGELVPRIPGLLRQPHRPRRLASAVRLLGAARELALRPRSLPRGTARRRRSPVGIRHRPASADPAPQRSYPRRAGRPVRGRRARRVDPRRRLGRRARGGCAGGRHAHRRRRRGSPAARRARGLPAAGDARRGDQLERADRVRGGRRLPDRRGHVGRRTVVPG
jgi:hypothetical protein